MAIVITHLIMLSAGAALYAWARRSAINKKSPTAAATDGGGNGK